MDPQTLAPDPATKSPPNVYQIGGVPVKFPYKPYGSQLAFMGRVIATLERAHRQGHCHALLESPTGTGKTLSLLCSAIAWQQQHRNRMQSTAYTSFGNKGAPYDPLINGGGFVPEGGSSIPNNVEQIPQPQGTSKKVQKKVPTIYYATRTHSQISQVIREYKKTSYRVPMAILAARKHYCTNDYVCSRDNIDEECKLLLKDEVPNCLEFKNANKIRNHHSIQRGGCYEVHDIEDLVKVARTVKGCAYFAAQALAEVAQIVFCPYNYIINPIVRRAMDLDIRGSILILDEAHNIEDFARSAGSLEVEDESLSKLQSELGQLSESEGATIYQPLHDMIQGLVGWISERKLTLQKHDFEHYCSQIL